MADRLAGPVRVDRVRIVAAGERGEMGPTRLAQPAHHGVDREGGEVADGAHTEVVQALRGRRADAPQRLDGVVVQELELDVGLDDVHAGARREPGPAARGLAAREASLAMSLARPMPTEQPSRARRGPAAQAVGDLAGRPEEPQRPATSTKASSRPIGSTSGVTSGGSCAAARSPPRSGRGAPDRKTARGTAGGPARTAWPSARRRRGPRTCTRRPRPRARPRPR